MIQVNILTPIAAQGGPVQTVSKLDTEWVGHGRYLPPLLLEFFDAPMAQQEKEKGLAALMSALQMDGGPQKD